MSVSNTTSTEQTRAVVEAFGRHVAGGDFAALRALFADEVDFDIPGATDVVPWIGRRTTGEAATEFYTTLDHHLERQFYETEHVFADGEHAVLVGRLRSKVLATGRLIETPFSMSLTVSEGRITRLLMLEDSHLVAEATRR
ncbi:nuclear transport factor 2 family protein [Saccharomonospora sp. NPDC006951]